MRNLPASQMEGATLNRCVIADGCRIGKGTTLEHCLIGVRSRIGDNCRLTDTVMIGSDRYQPEGEQKRNINDGIPLLNVGDNTVITKAILDKDCRVGANVRIVNESGRVDFDDPEDRFNIREGIVCVPRGAIIPDGTVI